MPKRKMPEWSVQCDRCSAMFNPRTIKGAVHLASCKQYNGWLNYETWAVALHLDNSEPSQTYWHRVANEVCKANGLEEWGYTSRLADILKEAHEERAAEVNECHEGITADLLNAALGEVDWHEIASHYIQAAREARKGA